MRKDATCLLAAAMLAASLGAAFAECQCLANGRKYQHGEIACLMLPNGSQLARCDMVLNNSSWKKIGDECPEAGVTPPGGPVGESAPAATVSGKDPLQARPSRSAG